MILNADSLHVVTRVETAYAAGLVDGEAYLGIKKDKQRPDCQNPSYHAKIQIRMVDEGAIRFVQRLFGGNYYKEKPNADNGRPLYCYQASDAKAQKIIGKVLPYLIVKRVQAHTILDFRNLQADGAKYRTKITGYRTAFGRKDRVANYSYSQEYIEMCEGFYLKCKRMNKVGRDDT